MVLVGVDVVLRLLGVDGVPAFGPFAHRPTVAQPCTTALARRPPPT